MLLIALALVAGQVPAEAPTEAERLRDLNHAFRKARNPDEAYEARAAAVTGLAGHDSKAVAEALLEAYRTVAKELEPIEKKRDEYLAKGRRNTILEKRPDLDPEHRLQKQILAALMELEEREALEPLLERVLLDERLPWTLRLSFAPRVTALDPLPLGLVGRALRSKREPSTLTCGLIATEALGHAGRELGGWVLELLKNDDPSVRGAAVRALTALELPGSLEPLIAALEQETGRAKLRVARSLQTLTREPIGAAPDAWRRWLAAEGAPFVAGEVALGGGEPAPAIDAAIEASSGRYHSLPLDGEAIVFVIDRSLSMEDPLAGGGRYGRGDRDRERPAGEETRMDRAKAELTSVLGRLPPVDTFDVIAFAGSTRLFSAEMVPATPDNVAEAQAWVNALELDWYTGIYDALDLAFRIAGRPPQDRYWPSAVDTIYLLTDGRPMLGSGRGRGGGGGGGGRRGRGDDDEMNRILADVRRWNALDRVVLHTIGMGDVPRGFMESLAEGNGGQFAHETGTQ